MTIKEFIDTYRLKKKAHVDLNFLETHSKNLFDGSMITGSFSNNQFDFTSDSYNVYKSIKIYLAAGTYTLSFASPVSLLRTILDGTYSTASLQVSQYTFEVTKRGYVGFSFRDVNSAKWDNRNVQIELGSTATEYEPHITNVSYFDSFTNAVTAINNNDYSGAGTVLTDTSVAKVIRDSEKNIIVCQLLADITVSTQFYFTKSVIWDLNGHAVKGTDFIYRDTADTGIEINELLIYGRKTGSKLYNENVNKGALVYVQNCLNPYFIGGEYEVINNSASTLAGFYFNNYKKDTNEAYVVEKNIMLYGIKLTMSGTATTGTAYGIHTNRGVATATLVDCTVEMNTVNKIGYGIGVFGYGGLVANIKMNNCKTNVYTTYMPASDTPAVGIYIATCNAELKDCYAYSHAPLSDSTAYGTKGIYVFNQLSTAKIINCYSQGTHVGVSNEGAVVYIVGGLHESETHGGFYNFTQVLTNDYQTGTMYVIDSTIAVIPPADDNTITEMIRGICYTGYGATTYCDNVTFLNKRDFDATIVTKIGNANYPKTSTLNLSNCRTEGELPTCLRCDADTFMNIGENVVWDSHLDLIEGTFTTTTENYRTEPTLEEYTTAEMLEDLIIQKLNLLSLVSSENVYVNEKSILNTLVRGIEESM